MKRNNILFILPCSPIPLESGGMQAIFNGIEAIRRYHNIYITYPSEDKQIDRTCEQELLLKLDRQATILPYKEKQPTHNYKQRILLKILRFIDKSHICTYWIEELLPQPNNYSTYINDIILKHKIDIVQCEMLCTISFIQSLPNNIFTVFIHHELGFVRHNLEKKNINSNLFIVNLLYYISKKLEIKHLNRYNKVITLSSIDRIKLINEGVTAQIETSFAIVNTPNNKAIHKQQFNKYNLTFIGPDLHEPNVLGINWFLKNCWQKLLSLNANYHLTIIGKWSQKNKTQLQNSYPNIFFAGFVDDLSLAINDSIMIVPLTVGSGIRMKILEAATIGVPFVSTTIGAEGIPIKNGEHCVIADKPNEFVKGILSLQNKEFRDACSKKAMQLVKDLYSIESLRNNRLSIYNSFYET